MESFFYSSKLASTIGGRTTEGLFHVTDWFPTILSFAGITYNNPKYDLDGFDQSKTILTAKKSTRDYVLYNYYTNIDGKKSDFFNNAGGAIRNSQYKLLHTYVNDNEAW